MPTSTKLKPAGKWIKDGFITYGSRDWHYFPTKGKISACNSMLAHQLGWDKAVDVLPDTANKLNTCKSCLRESTKYSAGVNAIKQVSLTKRCGKVCYLNEAEAFKTLIHIRSKGNEGRHETRTYFCKPCDSWHLTSQT